MQRLILWWLHTPSAHQGVATHAQNSSYKGNCAFDFSKRQPYKAEMKCDEQVLLNGLKGFCQHVTKRKRNTQFPVVTVAVMPQSC